MSAPPPPPFVVFLLQRFQVDSALIGDIMEQYAYGRSRVWLWRQIISAVTLALIGHAREPRPHARKDVRLTAMPAGSPVGGLGLLALAILLGVVAPDVWWVLAAAGGGGFVLGAALIMFRRGRMRRSPARRLSVVFCHSGGESP